MIPVTSFAGKTIAVFGLGGSGLACCHALKAGGAEVIAGDDNADAFAAKAPGMRQQGSHPGGAATRRSRIQNKIKKEDLKVTAPGWELAKRPFVVLVFCEHSCRTLRRSSAGSSGDISQTPARQLAIELPVISSISISARMRIAKDKPTKVLLSMDALPSREDRTGPPFCA